MSNKAIEEHSFFHLLNQSRVLAILVVFIGHVELYKSFIGSHFFIPIYQVFFWGHLGLNYFFVLSGFVVTYTLLKKQLQVGHIDILNFYLRRILRIWPLYYLTVAIAFFIVPWLIHYDPSTAPYLDDLQIYLSEHFETLLAQFLLLVPNFTLASGHFVPCGGQCWFIGVEQQFYLMWPLLLSRFKTMPWLIILGCIAIKLLLLGAINLLTLGAQSPALVDNLKICTTLILQFDIEALAMGGIAAYLLLYHPQLWLVRVFRNRLVQAAVFIALITISVLTVSTEPPWLPVSYESLDFGLNDFFFSVAFAGIILILAQFQSPPLNRWGKILNYGGTITYGFYMFHIFSISLMLEILKHLPGLDSLEIPFNILLYAGALTLTLVFSIASYELYESRFLQFQRRFPS
jgi:peptidoglycan/LPS O-acetylase OafA/YrhL